VKGQILRFALVGTVNTGTYYVSYRLLCLWLPYLAAHVLATVLSMIGSFFMNVRFTFGTSPSWQKFLRFPLTNVTSLVLTTVGVYALVSGLAVDPRIAPLIAALGAIPVTFVIARCVLVSA
jgi:putative flippase GtrA